MRSRVAAQTLIRNSFKKVFNLSGGIKAWKKEVAVGSEETGMHLFSGEETPEQAVVVGFGLEMGLRDFYLSMGARVTSAATKSLFGKLAEIEVVHQNRLVELHGQLTGSVMTSADFAEKVSAPAMEGGLTTDEYLDLYDIDMESEIEVLGLAMAIEAQALDLYLRAARRSDTEPTSRVLLQIADEERSHIKRLSDYIDQHQELS